MIIPGILEKSLDEIVQKIRVVEPFAPLIQIDFADGVLVDGLTFLDIDKINEISSAVPLEIHLMVLNPLDYLKKRINNAIKICSQVEAPGDKEEFITQAKKLGYKVGLSISAETEYTVVEPYIHELDFVQFMGIVPGGQGRTFHSKVIDKIRDFRTKYPKIPIQIDGSINELTIPALIEVGVNNFIVGSAIFNTSNPSTSYAKLNSLLDTPQHIKSLSDVKKKKIEAIAFLGGAVWKETDQPYKDAFAVAKILAEAGYKIINGGGPGVMRAATKGAHAGGGHVIAITYHPNKPKRHYEGVDKENDFDDEILTLDYFDRTKVMLQTTQMHIVFKGSIGTLSEFGMTWISSWIHEPDSKPIILYGDTWADFLNLMHKDFLIEKSEDHMFKICTTPQQVLETVKSFED